MTWQREPGLGSYARAERERRFLVRSGPPALCRLDGLRLAEVEVDDLGAERPLPSWLGPEVTHDDRFSGGRLAGLDDAADLLAEVRRRTG